MMNDVYPIFVYRLDERNHVEIFSNGFQSWGQDEDILKHITGASTRNHTSAYIATSSDVNYLKKFAYLYGRSQRMFKGNTPETLYVYKIRNQPNMISVKDFIARNNLTLPPSISFTDRQNEYLVLRKINKFDIVECQPYRLNADRTTYSQAEKIRNEYR
ncbi:scabin-related ADP-ribosyltransferase [Serratia fonticola]|uniref:scabin-related ADP-ribosyltransferase n=1 Tax=Serratia fonticola TaxID=47917 RepID=UPI002DB68B62|nr:hypothetical protein [Serratia fonticola]MEB7886052.1 hypothetical protein [Serratia fonticola]